MSVTATPPIPQPAGDGLIPVFQGVIGGVACNVCDARTLHAFLEVGKDFTTWIKDRIQKYQFVENQDFAEFSPDLGKIHRGRGRPSSDYHLTLDMAKELSMVENNEKGRQARRYFIECERRALEALTGNHSEAGVPQMIEHAAEATAMRIAMDGRDRVLTLFGPLANEGDKEQVSGLMIRAKERVKQYLLQLAKRHRNERFRGTGFRAASRNAVCAQGSRRPPGCARAKVRRPVQGRLRRHTPTHDPAGEGEARHRVHGGHFGKGGE